jgi:tetratricopeptide (TPR) repeat protein
MKLTTVLLGVLMLLHGAAEADDLPDFDKLWDHGDPAGTEAEFREILAQAEASEDVSYHLQLLTQIARTQGLQGRYEEAHATLDEVEKELTTELTTARIRYLLERGRVLNSSGHPADASPFFLKAWELSAAAGEDFRAVDAAHMMGIVAPLEDQLTWNLKAMQRAEGSEDERARAWLGSLYNNIGFTYLEQEDYAAALESFQKGWDWRKARDNAEATRIAKWTVAHTLRKMGQVEKALSMQRELEKERAEAEAPGGFVFEEIAECLLAEGKTDAARPYFAKAYDLLKDVGWIAQSDPERLERLRELGGGS